MKLSHLVNSRRRQSILGLWVAMFAVVAVSSLVLTHSTRAETQATFVSGSAAIVHYAAAPPQTQVLGASIKATEEIPDPRIAKLARYLKAHHSPLADHAETFITVADTYKLDWRLLPALAGLESSFGVAVPEGSYDAWGWIGMEFDSWDDGITTVGKGLRQKYYDQGLTTLPQIEARYAPPSAANPNHPWLTSLQKYMNELN